MNLRLLIVYCFWAGCCFSQGQEESQKQVLDMSHFYGSILLHNPDISHLITDHPGGVILSYNKKTYGDKLWQQRFNYPDTGYSLVYQNMNNNTLGKNIGLYVHYNFYFLRRNLQFRLGQGIAYNTNPFDKNENFRNNAYGSHLLSSTYLMLNYQRENIFNGWGVKAGLSVIHYSNANVRAPNTSTNTLGANIGLTYDLDGGGTIRYKRHADTLKTKGALRYNLAFRSGINESDVVDSGQYAFYIFSAYADKQVGRISALQLGADLFFSNFLKELIRYQAVSFPDYGVRADTDYRRVGVFVGHELFINKMSVISQLGYYVYYPFDFEGRVYNRMGIKRYFNDKIYGAVSLKSHGAKAEAVEFGVGIRL
ncbi:Lipid A 3-O-deacylase (PagL) [Arenibacter nanhaiticus]|uniref:Lipid A 3-O-deacylase (PagL) n=1 Tax=Arenibacter nanhaiticus TaxID=558155 RepID=A0A1M6HJM6_9FLAO|nr:acyloxyacyl hydrolase [Arenibacter nanhaiticus]SHJ22375.1 Lipid A 3-O-deacylase (PagL) [Arenibacter nanhaiticus]